MCLGIPVQVIESGEHYARCAGRLGEVRVDLDTGFGFRSHDDLGQSGSKESI